MKIYSILLSLFTLAVLAACSGEETDNGTVPSEGGADVTLSVTAPEPLTAGIAARAFTDTHATEGEMMKNYIIVAVNESTGLITHILQSGNLAEEKESDTYKEKVHFDTGTYTFYTFANLTLDQLDLTTAAVGDAAPDFDSKTLAVDGNQSSVSGFTNGIPMSYKQTGVTINARTDGVTLYVMRMVAKMTLQLTNATGQPLTLNSITLSDITKNVSDNKDASGNATPNLYLLPTTATDANKKEYATPRLTPAATATNGYGDYTVTPSPGITIPAGTTPTDVTFYVNESQAHDPASFQLTLNLTATQADGTTTTTNSRYAILNWTTIGRNDYRVIPITIDDYKLTFDVKYFTAIGVLPPTVTDDGTTLNLNFSYYGDLHLVPKLQKWSDGTDVTATVNPVYDASSCWTLVSGTNPNGFFATAPYWNSRGWVEASIGFTEGTSAVYRLQATIIKTDGTAETLSRSVRFKMTPVTIAAKAYTPTRDTWHWVTTTVR